MTSYYGAVRIDGRWTPVVIGDHGAPTYRAAAERIADVTSEMALEEHDIAATILLDLGSVDLTNRDDFLALMAYDPVLRTMFDFAASGGANTADAIERGELPADARLLDGSRLEFHELTLRTDGNHLPGTEVTVYAETNQLTLDELDRQREQTTRRCRVCGCTDEDCSQCIESTGEPCSWVEPDLCSACLPVPQPAGSKDDAPPNEIADAIAAAGAKGDRTQALRDFKPLLDLAIDKLVANAQSARGARLHEDTVRQLAQQAYGQAFRMLAALGVTAEEMEQADLFPEDLDAPST